MSAGSQNARRIQATGSVRPQTKESWWPEPGSPQELLESPAGLESFVQIRRASWLHRTIPHRTDSDVKVFDVGYRHRQLQKRRPHNEASRLIPQPRLISRFAPCFAYRR